MIYLLIVILIGVVSAGVENYYCKSLFRNISDSLLYQLITYAVGLVCTLIISKFMIPSGYTLLLGVIVGVLLMCEVYCILQSMTNGPLSLTTLFSMAALVLPVCMTPVLWNEPLTKTQILGTVLVVISMFLILDVPGELKERAERKKKAAADDAAREGNVEKAEKAEKEEKEEKEEKSGSSLRSWLPYAVGAFFFGGACAFPENYLVRSPYAGESQAYTSVAFLVVILLTVLALRYRRKKKGEQPKMKLTPKLLLPLILIGIGSSATVLLIIEALKYLPTSVTYGGNNGARLILITLMDVVLFKQKLKPVQIAGMILGLAALICLSI